MPQNPPKALERAKEIAEERRDDWMQTLLHAINPKNMSEADQRLVQDYLERTTENEHAF